jgi:hypothetical protein
MVFDAIINAVGPCGKARTRADVQDRSHSASGAVPWGSWVAPGRSRYDGLVLALPRFRKGRAGVATLLGPDGPLHVSGSITRCTRSCHEGRAVGIVVACPN